MDIYFENKAREVLDIYSQVELELLELIIKKLKLADGEIGGSTEWLIKRLQELGGLNKETLKVISKYTGISQKELKKIFKQTGIDTIDSVNLAEAYKKGKITINPSTFKQDKAIMTIVNNSYNEALKTFFKVNENIVENVKKQYIDILNTAYLETSTGVYDYGTSIRKALARFADRGITVATYRYPDGSERKYNIEGIVRRDLLTAMHQTSGKVMDEVVDKTKPEYIKITEHYQARPSHEPWQGCIVRKDEFDAITGFGEVDGIYGVNCKHGHFPFFGEVDENRYKMVDGYDGGRYKAYTQLVKVDEKENARLYELSQEQRSLERHVREWKRRQIVDEDKTLANKKVKFWQHKLRNFIDDNPDLRRDYLREKI